jgi:hypothetical protein
VPVVFQEPFQQLAFPGGADNLFFGEGRASCHGHTVPIRA